jgi:uncharacterized protein
MGKTKGERKTPLKLIRRIILVKIRLMPRDEEFFDMLERAADNALVGVKRLDDMIEHYENIEYKAGLVKESEHHGDEITHEMARKLSKTFITPIDREDIRALSSALDDILDYSEGASETMVLCKIEQPSHFAVEMSKNLVEAVEEVTVIIRLLRQLKDARKHIIAIHGLENKGDALWRSAFADLFENDLNPLTAMKWKELYQQLEEAVDACETVSDVFEEIVLKYA